MSALPLSMSALIMWDFDYVSFSDYPGYYHPLGGIVFLKSVVNLVR